MKCQMHLNGIVYLKFEYKGILKIKKKKRNILTKLKRKSCLQRVFLLISSKEGIRFVCILLREAKHLNILEETYLGYFLNNKQQRIKYFWK